MNYDNSILAVGSIAFDDLETPNGIKKNVLGGSATYFSIAASLFSSVKIVGVVGKDFPQYAWEFTLSIGDEIAAYGEDGRLIGSTVYEGNNLALTLWGDDVTTNEKDGLVEGERIIFRLWNSTTSTEQVLDINCEDGSGIYSTDAISVAGHIILSNELTTEKQLVKITDLLGREVNGDEKDVMLVYIYDDNSIERVFIKE